MKVAKSGLLGNLNQVRDADYDDVMMCFEYDNFLEDYKNEIYHLNKENK